MATAGPVDLDTFGPYSPPPTAYEEVDGRKRLVYPIDDRVTDDPAGEFVTEAGRYHLYVTLYCPWAQRPLIAVLLRGLEDVVTWSSVDPSRDARGWAFREGRGHGPDPVNGFAFLRQAYDATRPGFDGHVSVPALWDRRSGRLVSNHYPTMTNDLETEFRKWADPAVDLYPAARRDEVDAVVDTIVGKVSGSTYAARAAAGDPAKLESIAARVAAVLTAFDERLARQRFLVGDAMTDADLLLYVNLQRLDPLVAPAGLLALPLDHYEHLWAYARDLYQRPEFRRATDWEHLTRGLHGPGSPAEPKLDWEAPATR